MSWLLPHMGPNILILVLPQTVDSLSQYFRTSTKPVGSIALNFIVPMGFCSSLNLISVNPKVGWNWHFVTARIPFSTSAARGQGSGQTESESLYLQHGEWKCYIFSLHFLKSTCYTLIYDCIFNCYRGNEVFYATRTTHIVLMCSQPGVIFMMY